MNILLLIILSSLIISLLSFSGALVLFFKERILKKIIFPLVAFSAGALLAGAFLHMIPEALEASGGDEKVFIFILFGFIVFLILEQFIHWHHCHKAPYEHKKPVTYLILISDFVHNFIDGLAISSAFLVSTGLGFTTLLVVALHEIPQELGDFGILIHGGWSKGKALLFNFFSSLSVFFGAVVAYFISTQINIIFLLSFAAGGFIYIAAADLIPEIKTEHRVKHNIIHFLAFCFGLILIFLTKFFE